MVFARLTQEHSTQGLLLILHAGKSVLSHEQECVNCLKLELRGWWKHLVFEDNEAFELPLFIIAL